MTCAKRLLSVAIAVVLAMPIAASFPTKSEAQSYRQYCHDRAQRLSGYSGRSGNVVGGAIRGAVGGAVLSGILGGSKSDRKRGAKIGAVIGGLRSANRPNSRSARIYRLEFEECMRRR